MRKPELEVPPPLTARADDRVTQIRQYRLITPLFGGGVAPREADPLTTIRGTEVRGHLRFWWRATRGGRFNGDPQAMKQAEDELWGAASTPKGPVPSKVLVQINILDKGHKFIVRENSGKVMTDKYGNEVTVGHYRSPYSYVAFPLEDHEIVLEKVRFELTLSYEDPDGKLRPEVEAALWAWETFGGIGARTRRGFGALQLISLEENDKAIPIMALDPSGVAGHIKEQLQKHVATGKWPDDISHLSRNLRFEVVASRTDPLPCWRFLINALKNFRQSRPWVTDARGRRRPGRSNWPEANEIRHLTGQSTELHSPPKNIIHKFPRAYFGLPIGFQFKDADDKNPDNPNADPRKTVLQGIPDDNQQQKYDRQASPLILRPIACHDRQYIGMALLLEGPKLPPTGLELSVQQTDQEFAPVKAGLETNEAAKIDPLQIQDKVYADVLEAFLQSLKESRR